MQKTPMHRMTAAMINAMKMIATNASSVKHVHIPPLTLFNVIRNTKINNLSYGV